MSPILCSDLWRRALARNSNMFSDGVSSRKMGTSYSRALASLQHFPVSHIQLRVACTLSIQARFGHHHALGKLERTHLQRENQGRRRVVPVHGGIAGARQAPARSCP